MRKSSVVVVLVVIILGVTVFGCASPQISAPEIKAPPTSTFSPVPIYISPFYNSQSNEINVGDFSQELGTRDFQELTNVAQAMAKQRDALTPEQMFVLAIRLFDLGDNNNAVYWFYEAQFRAKLFQIALEPSQMGGVGDPTFELSAAYRAFTQLSGEYINGYAGCDIENWVSIATTVKNDNSTPPDLGKLFPNVIFVERSQWPQLNNEVAEGLDQLIVYLSENKETVQQQRKQNNADEQYCQ